MHPVTWSRHELATDREPHPVVPTASLCSPLSREDSCLFMRAFWQWFSVIRHRVPAASATLEAGSISIPETREKGEAKAVAFAVLLEGA